MQQIIIWNTIDFTTRESKIVWIIGHYINDEKIFQIWSFRINLRVGDCDECKTSWKIVLISKMTQKKTMKITPIIIKH